MSLHLTPEQHYLDPPEKWSVGKFAPRGWRLMSSLGWVIDTYPTRWQAAEAKTHGRYAAQYRSEARWFAGLPVTGWKPYTESAANSNRRWPDPEITPDTHPDKFTEAEAALFRAGKCGWQTVLGMPWMGHCEQPSEPGAPFGYCPRHRETFMRDLIERQEAGLTP